MVPSRLLSSFCASMSTIDEDTKVIEIVRDGVYPKDPENVILDWERKETIYLIPDESNNYTKSVWASCKEVEDVNEDDYEYYPFNRYEKGNGNPDIDIECYDKFDFYVSKDKLEQIESFCGGVGVLSETTHNLCFNLTYTYYNKDQDDFESDVLQDPELIYKLRDINKFIEYSKENINDIEFIGFNMKVKLNILREMSRLSFFCPDMVHFIGDSECKYGSEKSCNQSTCNMGRLELYEAILQIYFYKYVSRYS
ncbi:hypothetical protein CYY_003425 [Polysphondylium violaceum]|uniref:Uncharacterized protein n=1 Tax=Polysphondylium violaceum TaxID=133409 RepID=A0A8J4Q6V8_9MYCE|nr:hypothetical protein CYY_003425 [Polysphondylium violaceum]